MHSNFAWWLIEPTNGRESPKTVSRATLSLRSSSDYSARVSKASCWAMVNSGLAPRVRERVDLRSKFCWSFSTLKREKLNDWVGESLRIVLGFIWVKWVPKNRDAFLNALPNIL